MTGGMLCHLVGGSADDKGSPRVSPFGSHIDDPVRAFDDFEIVFDHDEGISAVAQSQEHFEQFLNVGEVESGRGLIQ